MNLPEFLRELGDERAADAIGVKARTVGSWRRGERMPRPAHARCIILLSDGRLDFSSIYSGEKSAARKSRSASRPVSARREAVA